METMFACIVGFSRSANSNMLIKSLKEQKKLAIATKFRQKSRNAQNSILYAIWWQFLPCCMPRRRGLAMRILSVSLSVSKSVRLSNACIVTKRKKDLSRFFTFSLVFWEEEWLVGATTSTWNFGSTGPHWSKIADFEQIFVRSASAVTTIEKKFN